MSDRKRYATRGQLRLVSRRIAALEADTKPLWECHDCHEDLREVGGITFQYGKLCFDCNEKRMAKQPQPAKPEPKSNFVTFTDTTKDGSVTIKAVRCDCGKIYIYDEKIKGFDKPAPKFAVGQRVRHKCFGEGTIIRYDGTRRPYLLDVGNDERWCYESDLTAIPEKPLNVRVKVIIDGVEYEGQAILEAK